MADASPAAAQGLPLIRDTEIENLLKEYSQPIFKAAGLGSQNIAMRIIRHESFNAFVADGRSPQPKRPSIRITATIRIALVMIASPDFEMVADAAVPD